MQAIQPCHLYPTFSNIMKSAFVQIAFRLIESASLYSRISLFIPFNPVKGTQGLQYRGYRLQTERERDWRYARNTTWITGMNGEGVEQGFPVLKSNSHYAFWCQLSLCVQRGLDNRQGQSAHHKDFFSAYHSVLCLKGVGGLHTAHLTKDGLPELCIYLYQCIE